MILNRELPQEDKLPLQVWDTAEMFKEFSELNEMKFVITDMFIEHNFDTGERELNITIASVAPGLQPFFDLPKAETR